MKNIWFKDAESEFGQPVWADLDPIFADCELISRLQDHFARTDH